MKLEIKFAKKERYEMIKILGKFVIDRSFLFSAGVRKIDGRISYGMT